ncbi:unnamed protein product [Clavelina lepadiformis]|uniref:Uncharacterized protein n=1 Tax=Clavelina lepadiformis TaxID=159417 RepID=A0ABP0F925_CLALP
MDNFVHLEKNWLKVLTEGGSTEDFRRMNDNVDGLTLLQTLPDALFWDETHKAFPEAKEFVVDQSGPTSGPRPRANFFPQNKCLSRVREIVTCGWQA